MYSGLALQARLEGKCIDCHENPTREGRVTCATCAAARSIKRKNHYLTNGDTVRASVKAWKDNHPEQKKSHQKSYRARLKAKVYALLGGKCAWSGCDWVDHRALQIDHKNGDGSKERADGMVGTTFLRKVLEDGGVNYQLLCANHNWVKRVEQNEARGRKP